MSAISLIIAITTAIYLCCIGGCFSVKNISFGDTSVTVLTAIIGLLVGWSIYSVIDTKSIIKKHEILKKRTANEIDKLKTLIKSQEKENERLRKYVNIVQNSTMANVRLTENRYGDALGLYCNAAIELNRMIGEYVLNRNSEEFEFMGKNINMAISIITERREITGSELLEKDYKKIIEGIKGIKYRNTKDIETYIEAAYN